MTVVGINRICLAKCLVYVSSEHKPYVSSEYKRIFLPKCLVYVSSEYKPYMSN